MPSPKPGQIAYYVIADRMAHMAGGHKVYEDADGNKRINMTATQAAYWIEQGAISAKHLDKHGPEAKTALRQMHGSAQKRAKAIKARPGPAEEAMGRGAPGTKKIGSK